MSRRSLADRTRAVDDDWEPTLLGKTEEPEEPGDAEPDEEDEREAVRETRPGDVGKVRRRVEASVRGGGAPPVYSASELAERAGIPARRVHAALSMLRSRGVVRLVSAEGRRADWVWAAVDVEREPDKPPEGTAERRVLDALRDNGGGAYQQRLADETGYSDGYLSAVLGDMEDGGLVRRHSVGRSNVVTLPGTHPRSVGFEPPGRNANPPREEPDPDVADPPAVPVPEDKRDDVLRALEYEGEAATEDVAEAAGVRVSLCYKALLAAERDGDAVLVRAPGSAPSDVRAYVWSAP